MWLELLKNQVFNLIELNQVKLNLYIHKKLAPFILYYRNCDISIIKENSTEQYWFDKHVANRDQFVTGMRSTTQTETKIKASIDSPLTTYKNQFELGKKPFSCRAR